MTQSTSDQPPARMPPASLDTEGLVLSHAFAHGTSSFPSLRPEHFYADANRHIFAAIQACEQRGEPTDRVAVARELRSLDQLQRVGGSSYLVTLDDCIPAVAPSQVGSHAAAIVELWKKRVLIAALGLVESELYGGRLNSAEAWSRFKEACDECRENV